MKKLEIVLMRPKHPNEKPKNVLTLHDANGTPFDFPVSVRPIKTQAHRTLTTGTSSLPTKSVDS